MLWSRMLPSVYRSRVYALSSSLTASRIIVVARLRCSLTCLSWLITSGMVTETTRVGAALRGQRLGDRIVGQGDAGGKPRRRLLDRVEHRGEALGDPVGAHRREFVAHLAGQLRSVGGCPAGLVE